MCSQSPSPSYPFNTCQKLLVRESVRPSVQYSISLSPSRGTHTLVEVLGFPTFIITSPDLSFLTEEDVNVPFLFPSTRTLTILSHHLRTSPLYCLFKQLFVKPSFPLSNFKSVTPSTSESPPLTDFLSRSTSFFSEETTSVLPRFHRVRSLTLSPLLPRRT